MCCRVVRRPSRRPIGHTAPEAGASPRSAAMMMTRHRDGPGRPTRRRARSSLMNSAEEGGSRCTDRRRRSRWPLFVGRADDRRTPRVEPALARARASAGSTRGVRRSSARPTKSGHRDRRRRSVHRDPPSSAEFIRLDRARRRVGLPGPSRCLVIIIAALLGEAPASGAVCPMGRRDGRLTTRQHIERCLHPQHRAPSRATRPALVRAS